MTDYAAFLASKTIRARDRGLTKITPLAPHLFPFQQSCVKHHLRLGAAGCFLDTGLGKTEIELEFCQKSIEATNAKALIWTPLAVAQQTKHRADRWGYEARVIREQSQARSGINICNYDRLDKIDPADFDIVALDEASIMKSFSGKTRNALVEAHRHTRFKLCATATPAPNDHMELGNYAQFLDLMQMNEMLSRFFINDTSTASQQWRLKAHGIDTFWDWVASWARAAEKPSDLGDDDARFELPPFKLIRHQARDSRVDLDFADMFGLETLSATNLHDVKRQTAEARAETVAAIVQIEPDKAWLLWCDTNYEADMLKQTIPAAVEVRGSQSIDQKEDLLEAFGTGQARYLIAKPSMCGFGLDWSHCSRMIFVGRSYSYETWYQAIRRCWRFGQRDTVNVHLVVAEGETGIGRVIDRKSDDHITMKRAMRSAMLRALDQATVRRVAYNPNHTTELHSWISAA